MRDGIHLYDSFHWKIHIPKVRKIKNLGFLGLSLYTFKSRFWFHLNLYQVSWVFRFGGFRWCSIPSGICRTLSFSIRVDRHTDTSVLKVYYTPSSLWHLFLNIFVKSQRCCYCVCTYIYCCYCVHSCYYCVYIHVYRMVVEEIISCIERGGYIRMDISPSLSTDIFLNVGVSVSSHVGVSADISANTHISASLSSLSFIDSIRIWSLSQYGYISQCGREFEHTDISVNTEISVCPSTLSFIDRRHVDISPSFKYRLFYRSLLQKRLKIWRSLLIEATPYIRKYGRNIRVPIDSELHRQAACGYIASFIGLLGWLRSVGSFKF